MFILKILKWCFYLIVFIVAMLSLITMAMMFGIIPKPRHDQVDMFQYVCVAELTQALREPTSLQISSKKSWLSDDKQWIHAEIEYRAKNGFGGTNIDTYSCKKKYEVNLDIH